MKKHIFYIDDDVEDIELISEVANNLGEEICSFQAVTDLMHLLDNPPPHPAVVLIDLHLGVIDGAEVVEKIRASPKFTDVPIVMLSNAANPLKVAQSREAGANLFMVKPTSMKKISEALQYIIAIDDWSFGPEQFIYSN